MLRAILVLTVLLFSSQAYAAGKVVATIKPLHSLVADVMEGDDQAPVLLVDGTASLHSFALKPSQMQALNKADLVFYMGDSFETFLSKVFATLPNKVERISMEHLPEITLYPLRRGSGFTTHAHEHDEEHSEMHSHATGAYDLHLWMSVKNAQAMVTHIARALSAQYPAKKGLYEANARKLHVELAALDQKLQARLQPLKDKPFIVFHDAYQYFEKSYGLASAGSIMLSPDRTPGAKHLSEIRKKLTDQQAVCVFREPQLDSKVVESLIEGTGVKVGVLDPEGADLEAGPDLYFRLMEGLAQDFERCLAS